MKRILITLCLVAVKLELTNSQNMNRIQPNMLFNRHIPEKIIEAPRNFISQPLNIPYTIDYNPISPVPPKIIPTPSTTIVTDCTPSVCKNLANTLQLMIVCNLLQNHKGGPDLALQLASPFLNEAISSPTFSCGCSNPLFSNSPSLSPVITSTSYPNVIGQQSVVTGYSNTLSSPNSCPKSGLLNLLSMFSN
ncbi:uncharacterized protein LOC123704206 [Colias croceus]|uniref:uncharacterized protein LOC123704206 n=1 Tax=Colias crocea TaxID=72248 RepID=UPI001E27EF8B|nr:uncharacterized protein LOC123704206 [Colias croceus]